MSYILDALRKSDQQRQRGATPTLLTAQITAAEPGQSEQWIYALIAALLVGAGIAIGWLHPWQSNPPAQEGGPVARKVIAAKPLESGPRRTAPVVPAPALASPKPTREPARESTIQKPVQRPDAASASAVMPQDRPAAPGTSGTPTVAAARGQEPLPQHDTGRTDSAQRVMTIGELPDSIQQELPAMQISLHLHSTRPGNSFVSINDRMLQEGAFVAPGLRLEQITPDGMIFSYKGYRFRRGVQ